MANGSAWNVKRATFKYDTANKVVKRPPFDPSVGYTPPCAGMLWFFLAATNSGAGHASIYVTDIGPVVDLSCAAGGYAYMVIPAVQGWEYRWTEQSNIHSASQMMFVPLAFA